MINISIFYLEGQADKFGRGKPPKVLPKVLLPKTIVINYSLENTHNLSVRQTTQRTTKCVIRCFFLPIASCYTQNISSKHKITWFVRLSVTDDNSENKVDYKYKVANVFAIATYKTEYKNIKQR
jgi:hypothetical protein